ncbi:LysR family transcriptional regulator [Pelagibacterium sp.]|uniref:LysR family transcriptional regulator n=1 Tax=Pelagibacterium sp. TaxID=1967288 RepID=UPI003BA88CCE
MAMLRTALIYFDQAVRDGSIRKAAESLNIASSAINRQLLQLEQEMGVELFERLPRGIRPTAAGEVLLSYVRRWNREVASMRQKVGELRGGIRGTIRIAAAESITEDILPRALSELHERFPLVDYSLISGDNHRITTELFAKEADVVIAFDVADTIRADVVHTVRSPLGVICTTDHPLARSRTVTVGECTQYPLVIPGDSWLKYSGLHHLLSEHVGMTQIVARAERPGMLKAMVKSGLGIAFLTHLGVERDVAEGRLAWVPLARGIINPATISLMVPRGQIPPLSTMALIELLKRHLSEFAAKQPGLPAQALSN